MNLASKRLAREVQLMKDDSDFRAAPIDRANLALWEAFIPGPVGSPYEGGEFKLRLQFPADFPLKPPTVTFMTRIYHMNISSCGYICLSILDKDWSAAITVRGILLAIQGLLSVPNPKDPLVGSIAVHFEKDREGHDRKAARATRRYAMQASHEAKDSETLNPSN